MPVITLHTIQDRAIDFAVHIHFYATPLARKAIENYGECLRQGAQPGALTLVNFVSAMQTCRTPEYTRFTEWLMENEIILLNNTIARAVAGLEIGTRKAQR